MPAASLGVPREDGLEDIHSPVIQVRRLRLRTRRAQALVFERPAARASPGLEEARGRRRVVERKHGLLRPHAAARARRSRRRPATTGLGASRNAASTMSSPCNRSRRRREVASGRRGGSPPPLRRRESASLTPQTFARSRHASTSSSAPRAPRPGGQTGSPPPTEHDPVPRTRRGAPTPKSPESITSHIQSASREMPECAITSPSRKHRIRRRRREDFLRECDRAEKPRGS